jgi:dGTP triphosphohydrolase
MIDKLFTRYSQLALNVSTAKDFKSLRSGDAKLAEMTWGSKYVDDSLKKYRGDVMWWLHAATDHIVGMTDDYAKKTAALF